MIPVPDGSSQRLRFAPLIPRHAASLSEALLDPAVYEFIGGDRPESIDALAARFEHFAAGPPAIRPTERWWNIAVFSLEDSRGLGRLEATLIDDRAEIAYLLGSDHWGKGYAFEAMSWFHDRLAEDGAVSKLWATVLPTNKKSVRLLQRLGYSPVTGGWPELGSYDEGDLVFCRPI